MDVTNAIVTFAIVVAVTGIASLAAMFRYLRQSEQKRDWLKDSADDY